MSTDYTSTATVTVSVNGKDAENKLSQLRQRAEDLRNAIAKAGAEGDKTNLEKHRTELRKTTKEIRLMESSTAEVERVMRNLSRATPRELQRSLTQLNRELKNMERGTAAWDAQAKKIRQVRAELDSVNASLREHEGWFSRINRKLNDWGVTITAALASLTGLIMSARSAVQAYVDMDTAMANTRKFTGMTAEEVAQLNEEFKEMDTRSSRVQLNEMAQAAGRLGKNSVEDVMGFVRAADVIGVAMDELGDDAPQIIAQLAGIFNLEPELGTERSMLAVGSSVNTLSQNCAASAPNLVDFASRLGAIASQTGMTIDEMLAFGAVLDANRVSVEKSATAIQTVLSKMMADPADFARKAGMPVDEFTEKIKRSSTEGLMMFIEHLNQLDKMDVAGVLAELKVQDSGVIATFNTLAGKLGDVKTQLEASKKAFDEATSATEEYNVQNNTAEARLDKSKKKFHELAVELGEKLMPVMQYAISSTSAMMRVLSAVVSFIVKYRTTLTALVVGIIAYTAAVNASNIGFRIHYMWVSMVSAGQKILTATTLLAKAAFFALTGNITRATAAMRIFSAVTKANPWGLLIAGITAAVAALLVYKSRQVEVSAGEKAIADASQKAAQARGEEERRIKSLITVAENERLTLQDRYKAIDALNKIIPGYNASLDETTGKYQANKTALDSYLASLEKKARLDAVKENYQALVKAEVEAEKAYYDAQKKFQKVSATNAKASDAVSIAPFGAGGNAYASAQMSIRQNTNQAERAMIAAKKHWDDAKKSVQELEEFIQKSDGASALLNIVVDNTADQTVTPTSSGMDTPANSVSDALRQEYDRSIAEAQIAYARGETGYRQYEERIYAIKKEYLQKQLENNELEAADRAKLESELAQLRKSRLDQELEMSRADLELEYQARQQKLKEQYADGLISDASYREQSFRAELDYLEKLKIAWGLNSEEISKIDKQIEEKELAEKLRKKEEYENRLAAIEREYMGATQAQKDAAYQQDLADLNTVYQNHLAAAGDNAAEKLQIEEAYWQAVQALRAKYNQGEDGEPASGWVAELNDFINSDQFKKFQKGFSTVNSALGSLFSSYSQLVQAELDIQTNAINERYDKEVEAAQGNSTKISQIERRREAEIAQAKNAASKKQFSMQVIQALAQTAQNIISAVGAGMQFGLAAPYMVPLLVGIATATGAVQIAALKKQQQAAASQGYQSGGFTRPGAPDEPAGIVHAGEWVASQRLLANPAARSMINALDYAQRTNTIGSIRMTDIATVRPSASATHSVATSSQQTSDSLQLLQDTLILLNTRLNQPFVTINTVEGDNGIKKAQDEYNRLIRNKSPKWKS